MPETTERVKQVSDSWIELEAAYPDGGPASDPVRVRSGVLASEVQLEVAGVNRAVSLLDLRRALEIAEEANR